MVEFWNYCLPKLRNLFLWTLRPINITAVEAREYAADVMVEIYPKLGTLQNPTIQDILNYVYRSAFNLARYHLKRKYSYKQLREFAPWIGPATIVDHDGNVIEVVDHPILADPGQHVAELIAVKDALLELDKRDREVFNLRYMWGWSIKETAKITGLSQINVKAIASRARKKLRKRFEASCANV